MDWLRLEIDFNGPLELPLDLTWDDSKYEIFMFNRNLKPKRILERVYFTVPLYKMPDDIDIQPLLDLAGIKENEKEYEFILPCRKNDKKNYVIIKKGASCAHTRSTE